MEENARLVEDALPRDTIYILAKDKARSYFCAKQQKYINMTIKGKKFVSNSN